MRMFPKPRDNDAYSELMIRMFNALSYFVELQLLQLVSEPSLHVAHR